MIKKYQNTDEKLFFSQSKQKAYKSNGFIEERKFSEKALTNKNKPGFFYFKIIFENSKIYSDWKIVINISKNCYQVKKFWENMP